MLEKIGDWLAYINRARQYIGIVNSSLLLIILLKSFDVVLAWYWYPVLIIGTVLVMLIFGWVDTKLGIRKMEYLSIEKNQPIKMRDHVMLEEIHAKLKHVKL